jgi:hypothetical protein
MRDYADNRMEGEGRRHARRNLDGETGENCIPLSLHPLILLGGTGSTYAPALEERAASPEGGCRDCLVAFTPEHVRD